VPSTIEEATFTELVGKMEDKSVYIEYGRRSEIMFICYNIRNNWKLEKICRIISSRFLIVFVKYLSKDLLLPISLSPIEDIAYS